MWTAIEKELFDRVSHYTSHGHFKAARAAAEELLNVIQHNTGVHKAIKQAYVLACRYAVALRHLGEEQAAEEAFQKAHQLALEAGDHAILAYVLNDWASLYDHQEAIDKIQSALVLLQEAKTTPDPARRIEADRAYVQAYLARTLHVNNIEPVRNIRELFTTALPVLKQYARGSHKRYEQAYLLALTWRAQATKVSLRYVLFTAMVVVEAARQGKLHLILKAIR